MVAIMRTLMIGARLLACFHPSLLHDAWGSASAGSGNATAQAPQLLRESSALSMEDIRAACFVDIEADSQALNLVQSHARKSLVHTDVASSSSDAAGANEAVHKDSMNSSSRLPASGLSGTRPMPMAVGGASLAAPGLGLRSHEDQNGLGEDQYERLANSPPSIMTRVPHTNSSSNASILEIGVGKRTVFENIGSPSVVIPRSLSELQKSYGFSPADVESMAGTDALSLGQVGASYSFAVPTSKELHYASLDSDGHGQARNNVSALPGGSWGNYTSASYNMSAPTPLKRNGIKEVESGSDQLVADDGGHSPLDMLSVSRQKFGLASPKDNRTLEMISFSLESAPTFLWQPREAHAIAKTISHSIGSLVGADGLWHALVTPSFRVELEALRLAGYLPQREARSPCSLLSTWIGDHAASSVIRQSDAFWAHLIADDYVFVISLPKLIVMGWAAFFMVFFLHLMSNKFAEQSDSASCSCKIIEKPRSLEAQSWESSTFHWLTVGWCTAWIGKWGHGGLFTAADVSVEELGPAAVPEDRAEACHRTMEALWNEEVEACGLADVSLARVIMRFIGAARITKLALVSFGSNGMNHVVSVLAVDACFSCYQWLTDPQGASAAATRSDIVFPLALMIVGFTGVPLVSILLDSLYMLVEARTDNRIDAALSVMVYRKVQRLPAGAVSFTGDENDEHESAHEDSEKASASHVTKVAEARSGGLATARINAVQLVNTDIKANTCGLCTAFLNVIGAIPFGTFLLIFLWYRTGWAMCCGMATMLPTLRLMGFTGALMVATRTSLQEKIDSRLNKAKEVFSNIRLIKACGWESAHYDKIFQARMTELDYFRPWFSIFGLCVTISLSMPALLTFVTLGSYIYFNGSIGASEIFVCMQALGALQAIATSFFNGLQRIIAFLPSLKRVEAFLKLDEAPPSCMDRQPAFATTDVGSGQLPCAEPEAGVLHSAPSSISLAETTQQNDAPLRLIGSFAWCRDGNNVLHDLHLRVPRGRAVALVGNTGSGKSTLLQALLGELHGDTSAHVDIPGAVAYCSQTPWLVDGTLRKNVICSDTDVFDAKRYSAAVSSASISTDMKNWVGGDQVQVGAGGVSLSGGQQSRVALARAMYSSADVVLLDDPFASLDVHTSAAVFEQVITGSLMQVRTRIVALQPTKARLARFDEIIVMCGGRIVRSGPSSEVLNSDECQALLMESSGSVDEAAQESAGNDDAIHGYTRRFVESDQQRKDNECRSYLDGQLCRFYLNLADKRALAMAAFFTLLAPALNLVGDMQLASWANAIGAGTFQAHPYAYLLSFGLWVFLGKVAIFMTWPTIASHAYKVSVNLFKAVLRSLLSASIVDFHDRNPTGVVMQRLSQDTFSVDEKLPGLFAGTVGLLFFLAVSFGFVHGNMPLSFTIFSMPFYGLGSWLVLKYYSSVVRVMLLERRLYTGISTHICDAEAMKVSVRAYGQAPDFQRNFAAIVDNQLATKFSSIALLGWCLVRVRVLLTFWSTSIALICVLDTGYLQTGTFALCMCNISLMAKSFTPLFLFGSAFISEFQSVKRLQDYTKLPGEAASVTPGDSALQTRSTAVFLSKVGELRMQRGHKLQVLRSDGSLLFESTEDGLRLKAARGVHLSEYLGEDWFPSYGYFVTAVNAESKDAEAMALELCRSSSQCRAAGRPIRLSLATGWLVGGANVQIQSLVLRYKSSPDVLRGIDLTFTASQKIALVGRTGSGKSTLLLALLRIVEAHSGKIVINGVDIASIGLTALRQALGLVPQSPILFTGTIRSNLDPFGGHTDSDIWKALETCKLDVLVRSLPGELSHCVALGGENFSFGERQLISLARMVLRQPGLLLMDEATSSVDPHAQDQITTSILSAFAESTVVAVAHRLETTLPFEYVVVLDNGTVVEKGPVNELRSRVDGVFSNMLAARSHS